METLHLALFDCGGIQEYVFAGNRLRENIGASQIVAEATSTEIDRCLADLLGNRYVDPQLWRQSPDIVQLIEDKTLRAETLYQGGGNAVILFRNANDAHHCLAAWSRRLLRDVPGLTAVAVVAPLHPSQASALKEALEAAHCHLAALKRARCAPGRLQGLSVTANCLSTGLAATTWDDTKTEWISEEAFRKRQKVASANARLRSDFVEEGKDDFTFPLDFDDLGGDEGESHIAVVHADGNGMGERFRRAADKETLTASIAALRKLSLSVAVAGRQALQAVIKSVREGMETGALERQGLRPRSEKETDRPFLPIRPILYGGDDITLVCEGRIGLAVAAMFLREFHKCQASDDKPLHACAGVGIVRTHFPFNRAYTLTEEAMREAKRAQRNAKEQTDSESSWLDFHIALAGATGALEDIREHGYRTADGRNLLWRPWTVIAPPGARFSDRDWNLFEKGHQRFQDEWPRSKAKQMRDALLEGGVDTKAVLMATKSRGLRIPPVAEEVVDGWTGGKDPKTPYFDMLEALDFSIPLEPNR